MSQTVSGQRGGSSRSWKFYSSLALTLSLAACGDTTVESSPSDGASSAAGADLVFIGDHILTMADEAFAPTAVAVTGERIVATGSE